MWELMVNDVDMYHIISWLIIYSFLGWVWETSYVSFKAGKFINRGFVNGPVCTIYGFGAVFIYMALKPVSGNLAFLFVGGLIVATLLEYFTAVLMECIFHTSWWDYSDKKLNFQGRICLGASLGWGCASVIFFRILHPAVEDFVELYPRLVGEVAICCLTVLYAADFIYSAASAFRLHDKISVLERGMEALQGEFLVKLNRNMEAWMQKKGVSFEYLRERLEDVDLLRELGRKKNSVRTDLSRELEMRKEMLVSKMDHNLRRYIKSYPNLGRGYRLHHRDKKNKIDRTEENE